MLADAMIGLTIVGIIATIVAAAIGSEHAAEQRLADFRAANRTAERVLLNLQREQGTPRVQGAVIEIRALPGDSPAGFTWAQVDAAVNGRHAALVGLVPLSGVKS